MTPEAWLLLAYVVMRPGQPHPLEQLAAWIWPGLEPAAARTALQAAVTTCQHQVGSALQVHGDALIVERAAALSVDAWEFDQLLGECEAHLHRELTRCLPCLERMRRALALFDDEPLAGLPAIVAPELLDWLRHWREATSAGWRRLARAAAVAMLRRGDATGATVLARQILARDPFDGPAHQIMLRVLGEHDPAAALRYERRDRAARRRHRLPADPILRDLAKQIRGAALPTPPRTAIPRPLRRLVGRDAERDRLVAWLSDREARLVTILGPGGVGKTSLAMVVAGDLAWSFAHGAVFVSLLDSHDADALAIAIGRAIGYQFSGQATPLQQISGQLADRECLLVLDNLEPRANPAHAITELLAAAPRLQLLVTSRRRVNLRQELLFQLDGLSLVPTRDGARSDAVAFFLACLQATNPARDWLAHDHAAISQICTVVGGLPLAIELAAAQCRRMRPATLLRRIMARIDTLTTTSLAVPERQRRMAAIVAEVWQALGPTQQLVLMAMSVFRGTFDVAAIAATLAACRPTHDARAVRATMTSLIDRGMLQRAAVSGYALHPLLRYYTREQLARDAARIDELERGHAAWMLQRVHRAALQVLNPTTSAAAAQLGASFDDLTHAWHTLLRCGMLHELIGLIAPLTTMGLMLGWYAAIEGLFNEAIAIVPPSSANLRAGLFIARGWMQWYRGEFVAVHQSAQAALSAGLTDPDGLCMARVLLSVALFELGDAHGAAEELEAASDFGERAAVAPLILAEASLWLGITLQNVAPRARVQCAFERSLALFRQVDDWRGIAAALNGLAQLPWRYDEAVRADDAAESLRLFEEALQLARALGNTPHMVAVLLSNVGVVRILAGHDAVAGLAAIDEGLVIAHSIGNLAVQLELLHTRAYGLVQLQRWDAAQTTLVTALRQALGSANIPSRTVLEIIEGLGMLAAHRGDREDAAARLAVVLAHPQTSGFVRDRARTMVARLGITAELSPADAAAGLDALCTKLLAVP